MVGVGAQRVVRVLPDVVAIDKEFDYLVPEGMQVELGDVVRVDLHGRRVGGWIVALDVAAAPGVTLRPLRKVSGRGPSAELLELSVWAARRWIGRRASFLRTAAPPGVVRGWRPQMPPVGGNRSSGTGNPLDLDRGVLRLGPAADRYPLVQEAARRAAEPGAGQLLVLCPSVEEARTLGARLRRDGIRTAVMASDRPDAALAGEWTQAAFGGAHVVVGTRAAAWVPVAQLGRAVVLDEHDEVYQQEAAPTWHARDVVAERARRAGVPCLLVSPCPSLEALAWGQVVVPDRRAERAGWPAVEVVDQREVDPALGPLFSPRLVELVRGEGRVACVLNRLGRARLLACGACSSIARCEACDAAVELQASDDGSDRLHCRRCGTIRPLVCLECGGHRFKNLRLGVSRAREELEALVGETVAEVTGASDAAAADPARVVIGTEAVLHRAGRFDAVVFMDFDQELLALRTRAAEQALALLARAARLVGRTGADRGRVLVQTRTPEHPVLVAARHGDPDRLARSELPMRQTFGLPPATALAIVSGEAAEAFMDAVGRPLGVKVQGPLDGAWRVIAPDHEALSAALADVSRPPGRLRIAVDPLRA